MTPDCPNPQLLQYMDGTWHDPADEPRRIQSRQRAAAYDIAEELNLLSDDIEAGVFGDAARHGKFAAYVRNIKQRYPKPAPKQCE